jgi:hypothetical protein
MKTCWFAVKSTREISHAFIVRIWIEPRELKDAEPPWRGVIEAVDGYKRVYFDHLDKMSTYFEKYLQEIGIKIDNLRK